MSGDFLNIFTASFVTFFVLIDALGVAPIFASLTARGNAAYRRNMAVRSILVATLIIFGFAFFGAWLLQQLKITIDAFRAAGGVLLFLIALDMVFEKRTERRETRADEYLEEHETPEDVSVFPIGIPMLAGPGSIATAMLFMSESESWMEKSAVLSAIGANMVLCLLVFLVASPLVKAMGESVAGAITRIFGVILAALSAQLLIDGIIGAFGV
ncbi:MarC family protein [Henriciella aquimarina]|uniref:MarC family protein n=1 Tax=Henriciella aquimarina TaxID=545261 RepID=UPI000A0290AE|nr:MarC family protein [Henriciella aquimarina]